MEICGLQKLTLLDYPGRVACTIFTPGCNLRCPFCHNAQLVERPGVEGGHSVQPVLEFLNKRQGLLDGLCITGGEPLLQDGLEDFLRTVKDLGYLVKLDTNGCFPQRLKRMIEAGLVDYVAMDIKSSPAGYPAATGQSALDLSPIRQSADYLLSGPVDYEFRTTVVKGLHDAATLEAAVRSIQGAKRYYLQAFVDSGHLLTPGCSGFSPEEMTSFLALVAPYVRESGLRGV